MHFKRFSYIGAKLKNPLNFDEEIQIDAEYMVLNNNDKLSPEEIAKEVNHVYKLYAIIVHEGYSTSSGHYYSYIKNQDHPQKDTNCEAQSMWYRYDDEVVKLVGPNLSSVRRSTQNAYILFYKKYYL